MEYKPSIGVLLYTYDRVEDARINQQIIRSVWESAGLFKRITLVHAYNGERSWYSKKQLEDDLIVLPNTGHFQGASELIDAGTECFASSYPDVEYVVVLAADTWLLEPSYVAQLIARMKANNQPLATCAWFSRKGEKAKLYEGLAVDFFIVDCSWASRFQLFPLRYAQFSQKYADLFYAQARPVLLESVLLSRFVRAVYAEEHIDALLGPRAEQRICRMVEREPIHDHIDDQLGWTRNWYTPSIGLLTHHDLNEKKHILRQLYPNLG